MYEAFFGLREKPFSLLPDPALLYLGKTHGLAYSMLEYGLLHEAGFILVTGGIGCGKTTLIRHLLNQAPNHITVGLIDNTRIHSAELLQWIMLSLRQPYEQRSRIELFDAFNRFLAREHEQGRHVVLIIDEAQNLDPGTLEELRMLSNVNTNHQLLLQIILIGQPQLRARLAHPDLAQFTQRIAVDFHLGPLEQEETHAYIAHRLEKVGGDPKLFTATAMDRVYQASQGVPRIINLICDTALIYAFAEKRRLIDDSIVTKVLRDRADLVASADAAARPSGLFASQPDTTDDTAMGEEALELAVWRERPLDTHYPYVFLLPVACPGTNEPRGNEVLVAFAIDTTGYRKVIGIETDHGGRHQGWGRLLRTLRERGLSQVGLFICEASDELISDIMDLYPEASWQRDLRIFYDEILERVPEAQRSQIAIMLKIIHAQGDAKAAAKKANEIFHQLAALKLTDAASLLVSYAHESMTYYDYPREHHKLIRSGKLFRQALDEIDDNLECVTPLPEHSSRLRLFATALYHLETEVWEHEPVPPLPDEDTCPRAGNG